MRILALDHGNARIGCALSDPSGTLVRPIEVIEPPDPVEVGRVVDEHEVGTVVVGLPVTLAGEEGEQAIIVRAFCEQLRDHLSVPVETYDERLTTRMAQATRRGGAKAAEDSLAAAHLLEAYLMARESREAGDVS